MKSFEIFLAAALAALSAGAAPAAGPALKVFVLDNSVLCIRADRVPENLADQIRPAFATNRVDLSGAVLDLRFADAAATNADSYFIRRKLPLVVLVNGQTRGTAAALAAQLRASASAILIGGPDAPENISPDIIVSVNADDEKKFQDNPFFKPASALSAGLSATNDLMAFVDHTSEAELVRKRIKDGDDDGETSAPRAEPPQPVIRDPALARAVDLLKALAVLHPARG